MLAQPHGAKAPIVYYVDAVSGDFSVVRQITTDGNIGALKAKDITGWGLVCHRRVECGADDKNSSLQLLATDLSATSSGLYYNSGSTKTS